MHELTPESQALVFSYLESHPDPVVWDALLAWIRRLAASPFEAATVELPGEVLVSFVAGSEVEVAYTVVESRPPQLKILRIR